jgi:phosphoserine phosphatase RsbU/P
MHAVSLPTKPAHSATIDVSNAKATKLFNGNTHASLEELLHSSSQKIFVETRHGETPQLSDLFLSHPVEPIVLAVSLFSDTAYHQPVARYIAGHPALREHTSATVQANIEISLHEAIANAVIHGNFATNSNHKDAESFETHYQHIEHCLMQPDLCAKRVDIVVTIDPLHIAVTVTDQGAGYQLSTQQSTTHDSLHGRGISLIQQHASSVHHHHLGRSITMSFSSKSNPDTHVQTFSDRHTKAHLLIVDDTEFNLMILQNILEESGFTNLIFAKNGKEALEKIATQHIDLVVLDLVMPIMDGFEFTARIRQLDHLNSIPIIAQTAMVNNDERLKVFNVGCNDLITKPINPKELNSRIKMHLDYRFAAMDLLQSNERIRQELAVAHAMQTDLLPSDDALRNIHQSHGLVITGFSEPSTEIGGDLWFVQPISQHQTAFYTLDIAGHGVTAALNAFRIHAVIDLEALRNEPVNVFTSWLNRKICQILQPGQFATFLCGVIDTEKNKLFYATAACPAPIHTSGKLSRALSGEGFPLGIMANATYTEQSVDFNVGDSFFMYSDALTETKVPPANNFLSEASLMHEIDAEHAKGLNIAACHQSIQQRFLALLSHGKKPLNDDLTMVCITRER